MNMPCKKTLLIGLIFYVGLVKGFTADYDTFEPELYDEETEEEVTVDYTNYEEENNYKNDYRESGNTNFKELNIQKKCGTNKEGNRYCSYGQNCYEYFNKDGEHYINCNVENIIKPSCSLGEHLHENFCRTESFMTKFCNDKYPETVFDTFSKTCKCHLSSGKVWDFITFCGNSKLKEEQKEVLEFREKLSKKKTIGTLQWIGFFFAGFIAWIIWSNLNGNKK